MVKHLIAKDRNICRSVIQTNLGAAGCGAASEGCRPLGVAGVINTVLFQVGMNGRVVHRYVWRALRTREMVQSVKCLPGRYVGLHKTLGMIACAYNPRGGEAVTGQS